MYTDSDIPTTKKKALLGSDSGSDDEVGVKRQRLPSDSGSDPEAVRATAEDIFGEADDISEDEKEKNEQVSNSLALSHGLFFCFTCQNKKGSCLTGQ